LCIDQHLVVDGDGGLRGQGLDHRHDFVGEGNRFILSILGVQQLQNANDFA